MQKIRRLFFTAAFAPLLFAPNQKLYALQNKDVQTTVSANHTALSNAASSSPSEQKSMTLQTQKLPRIPRLSSHDDVFKQYAADVEESYKRAASGKTKRVQFYTYTPTANDTLFTVAAACSIPYETIATVNGIENISGMDEGKTIILPTDAGLFVSETPESSIEILIEKKYFPVMESLTKEWYSINGRRFYFLHGERFGSTERKRHTLYERRPDIRKLYRAETRQGYDKHLRAPFGHICTRRRHCRRRSANRASRKNGSCNGAASPF